MGASSPKLGHGLFPKWTRLQRLFCRLSIHFIPCIGFKLFRGFFFAGCLSFFIRCLGFLRDYFVLFISYLYWLLQCSSFFLGYLDFFIAYMCFFLGHRVLKLFRKPLRLFHKFHGFLGTLVAHAFFYASWGFF